MLEITYDFTVILINIYIYAAPLPYLRSDHLYKKDAQCAETNEKSYTRFFRFLVRFIFFKSFKSCQIYKEDSD